MSCKNDRVRSFLTSPKSRLRKKYDDIQDAEQKRESKFSSKTLYKARVIGLPREIQSTTTTATTETTPTATDVVYVGSTEVKVEEIDNGLPDPAEQSTAKTAAEVINMHSTALIPQSLAGSLQVGDIVIVEYMTPYSQDPSQTPKIKSKIRSDGVYLSSLQNVFTAGGGVEQFFTAGVGFGPISTEISNEIRDAVLKVQNRAMPMNSDNMTMTADASQVRAGNVQHGAVDLAAPVGEKIYAIGKGKITKIVRIHDFAGDYAYYEKFGGKSTSRCGSQISMTIKGGGQSFAVTYCHLSDIEANLKVNQEVEGGTLIAKSGGAKGDIPNQVGKGGGNTSGPHLHISIVPLGNKEKNNYRNSPSLYQTWWNGATNPPA